MRNMGIASEYFVFCKILVCVFFMKKKLGLKNKGTIRFTNHFDLGWKENSPIKIDEDPVELAFQENSYDFNETAASPGGLLGLIFAGYVPLASQSPYTIFVFSVANYRPHISHSWANM